MAGEIEINYRPKPPGSFRGIESSPISINLDLPHRAERNVNEESFSILSSSTHRFENHWLTIEFAKEKWSKLLWI